MHMHIDKCLFLLCLLSLMHFYDYMKFGSQAKQLLLLSCCKAVKLMTWVKSLAFNCYSPFTQHCFIACEVVYLRDGL